MIFLVDFYPVLFIRTLMGLQKLSSDVQWLDVVNRPDVSLWGGFGQHEINQFG